MIDEDSWIAVRALQKELRVRSLSQVLRHLVRFYIDNKEEEE